MFATRLPAPDKELPSGSVMDCGDANESATAPGHGGKQAGGEMPRMTDQQAPGSRELL
jgi:hypothetical protein